MTTARLMGKQPTKATWLQLAAAQAAKSFLKSLQVLAIFHHYLHTPYYTAARVINWGVC